MTRRPRLRVIRGGRPEEEAPLELLFPVLLPGEDAPSLEEIHREIRRARLRVVPDDTA